MKTRGREVVKEIVCEAQVIDTPEGLSRLEGRVVDLVALWADERWDNHSAN